MYEPALAVVLAHEVIGQAVILAVQKDAAHEPAPGSYDAGVYERVGLAGEGRPPEAPRFRVVLADDVLHPAAGELEEGPVAALGVGRAAGIALGHGHLLTPEYPAARLDDAQLRRRRGRRGLRIFHRSRAAAGQKREQYEHRSQFSHLECPLVCRVTYICIQFASSRAQIFRRVSVYPAGILTQRIQMYIVVCMGGVRTWTFVY